MTHETLMSKIVKIFQGPTDRRTDRPTNMTTPRSSDPELKKQMIGNAQSLFTCCC